MAQTEIAELDFAVANYGSVWQFVPRTPNALAFAQKELGLETYQWLGDTFNIEHRMAPDLLRCLAEEGWKIGPIESLKPARQ